MNGWNEDKILALFDRLDDQNKQLTRIATALEEGQKIGSPTDELRRAVRNLTDAINRNTMLGGR